MPSLKERKELCKKALKAVVDAVKSAGAPVTMEDLVKMVPLKKNDVYLGVRLSTEKGFLFFNRDMNLEEVIDAPTYECAHGLRKCPTCGAIRCPECKAEQS